MKVKVKEGRGKELGEGSRRWGLGRKGDDGRAAEVEGAATGQSREGRGGEGGDNGRDADVDNRGGRLGRQRRGVL